MALQAPTRLHRKQKEEGARTLADRAGNQSGPRPDQQISHFCPRASKRILAGCHPAAGRPYGKNHKARELTSTLRLHDGHLPELEGASQLPGCFFTVQVKVPPQGGTRWWPNPSMKPGILIGAPRRTLRTYPAHYAAPGGTRHPEEDGEHGHP